MIWLVLDAGIFIENILYSQESTPRSFMSGFRATCFFLIDRLLLFLDKEFIFSYIFITFVSLCDFAGEDNKETFNLNRYEKDYL